MLYQENNPKSLKDKLFTLVIMLVFFAYILLLIKVILFKNLSLSQILTWDVMSYRSVNFIPSATVLGYFKTNMSFMRIFANVFGNLGIFMPLGYLLPLIFAKMRRFKMILLTSVIISIIFEVAQYTFSLGSLDIDDFILNVAGAITGYGFFSLLKRLFTKKKSFYVATILIIIAAGSIMLFFIWTEFSDLIGINRYKTEYIGNENIPTRVADYNGTFKAQNKNLLVIYPQNIISKESPVKDIIETFNIDINMKTSIYTYKTKNVSKWETQIIYEKITAEAIKNIEPYSLIEVWLSNNSDHTADTIVFSDNLAKDNEVSISNQEINLAGVIKSVDGNIINVNLSTSIEMEDGTEGEIYNPHNTDLLKVNLDDDVEYYYKLVSENGEIIKERAGSKKDLKNDLDIDISCELQGSSVIAKKIIIYDIK